MKTTTLILAFVALTVCFVPSVHAITISPAAISSSTQGDTFNVSNLISGAGLIGSEPQSHYYYDFGFPGNRLNVWTTETVGFDGNLNYFDSNAMPVITMDLGTDYNLDAVYLWAYAFGTDSPNRYQGNSVREFELSFNTEAEGAVLFGPAEFSATMAHGKILPTGRPSLSDTEPRQDFPLPNPVRARYVQMKILSNYHDFDGNAAGGDRVGLSEIQFSTTLIPEPSSMFVALMGATILGIGRRWLRPHRELRPRR